MTVSGEIFPLEPAGKRAVYTLVGIALFCDALAVFLFWSGGFQAGTMAGAGICLAVSSMFFWFVVGNRYSSVIVDDRELTLRLPMYGRRLSLDQVDSDQIRTINNVFASPYQLGWRLNGLGVPGYSLGWFSSHGKGRMLASVTTPRVLVIPTREKYTLLLSAEDPEAVTARLRAQANRRR